MFRDPCLSNQMQCDPLLLICSPVRFTWEALVINELQPLMLSFNSPDLPPVPDVSGRLFLGVSVALGFCA